MITHLVGTPFMPQIDDGIRCWKTLARRPIAWNGCSGSSSTPVFSTASARSSWRVYRLRTGRRHALSVQSGRGDRNPARNRAVPGADWLPVWHNIPAKVTLPMGAPAEIAISGAQYELVVSRYFCGASS